MPDLGDREAFEKAGAGWHPADDPGTLSLDWLRNVLDQRERALRAEEPFNEGQEVQLRQLDPATPLAALRRYAYLHHIDRVRREQLTSGLLHRDEAARIAAAAQLLQRQPEFVVLGSGRRVAITGRSTAAMIAMARHDLCRRALRVDLDRVAALATKVEQQLAAGEGRRGHLRRRLQRLRQEHLLAFTETLYHTRCLLASALSEDGDASEHAPPWWREVTADDEVLLLRALFRVGPERVADMGPVPDDGYEPEHRVFNEELGFWSLLAAMAGDMGVPMAELMSKDLGQLQTFRRAGALYTPPAAAQATAPPPLDGPT